MIEPRETARDEPEEHGEGRSSPSRRFARLVGSPAARRLALPRLAGAVAVALLLLGLAWVGGSRLARSVVDWVDAQPDHQVAFADIHLEPEPPPYIRDGRLRILDAVRVGSRRGATFSLTAIDLTALRKDFELHCPWVDRVERVRRRRGRLEVRLDYRKPVALGNIGGNLVKFVDKGGVVLPSGEVDYVERDKAFWVRGLAGPLPTILKVNVDDPASVRPGLPWKRSGGDDTATRVDLRVLGAAKLAEFLQGRPRVTPGGKPIPVFVAIVPEEESLLYFLQDEAKNSIYWGLPPGSEPLGEPGAEEKWGILADWIDRHGEIDAKAPDCLWLRRPRAVFHEGRDPLAKSRSPK